VTRRCLQAVVQSRINYRLSYAIDLACPIALWWQGTRGSSDWITALLASCIGGTIFTFVEYALHRWVFHAQGTFAAATHRYHHRSPGDPIALPCLASAVASLVLWLLLTPLLGITVGSFLASGVLSGYFVYATLHHVHHATRRPAVPFAWLRSSWATHAVHHSCPGKNFGVTTSLWDHVFGTYQECGTLSLRHSLSSPDRAAH
jgi:sterol desaturase/sphingolipid hydroxylase (fatty acid hydroxylase superfamily)